MFIYLVNEKIEMLIEKKKNKIQLMKEVKYIEAETEAKLNKLIDIIEGTMTFYWIYP